MDLEDFQGGSAYARFSTFTVANAASSYRLLVSGYSGTAGDGLGYHSGRKFTTKDRDNDTYSRGNCAVLHKGPWWYLYYSCIGSNLNGKYRSGRHVDSGGVTWYQWKENYYSLKTASMKLRRNEVN